MSLRQLRLSILLLGCSAGIATASSYAQVDGTNCYRGHGGVNIDNGGNATTKTRAKCEAFCDATPTCYCIVTQALGPHGDPDAAGKCFRRARCTPAQCAKDAAWTTFVKPVPPTPAPPPSCAATKKACIYDPAHLVRSTDCTGTLGCLEQCCAACARGEGGCTAWSFVSGFKRFACNLYNRSKNSASGELRAGPSACTSGGILPLPAPVHPPPAAPPKPGPPCTDCPNILLLITDDQDLVLGGWEGLEGHAGPMWRIHTPICAPSRTELQSGRYYPNVKNDEPSPYWSVTSGAIGHLDLTKAWPHLFSKTLREDKGYTTALFGKCVNGNCGANSQASGMNLHQMGAFDKWFEGIGYVNTAFYDNEADGCEWPWPEDKCVTKTSAKTVGAGYLTSELGNRTVEWIRKAEAATPRRPWFVYYATHAPHGPCTPAPWYKDACPGVRAPRLQPDFNYSGVNNTACTLYPPGSSGFAGDGVANPTDDWWWNATDFPELTSCQPPFTEAEAEEIDIWARRRCQTLLSVDDTYTEIIAAIEELGQENNTFVLVTSDHGYNLGNHMLYNAKMQFYDHSLRIPMLFAGPGIAHDAKLDFLGTQVDLAPTILGLAGIPTPADMDGKSVVPLLVSEATARAQGKVLPGSVRQHLASSAPLAPRQASFHTYYNQGPWAVSEKWRLDDWSNTWSGLHFRDKARGYDYKYGEFDPFGKQTNFARPYLFVLFDLTTDPFELKNVYNETRATPDGAAVIGEMHDLLVRYRTCKGAACP